MSERWLVAMSGGVDSSVAAALLVAEGCDVVGVTMDLGSPTTLAAGRARCCGLPDALDARAVARRLGIRHYTASYQREFREAVIEPFLDDYAAGRTPIPCVPCNRVLKFDVLLARARALGAAGVVTGHYARIGTSPEGAPALYRPHDREKDQTYFLFDLPRERLPQIRLPLGGLQKERVRELARELQLETADKPESQGICFIPDGDVRGALGRMRPELAPGPGPIVSTDGRQLGQHRGAAGHTLGQRHGLGLADGPWYVQQVDVPANRVVVDRRPALRRTQLAIERCHWLDGEPPAGTVRVQVRHRHASVPGRVEVRSGGCAELRLGDPVWAPAAGQAAVVYDADDERLLGGGWIVGSH